MNIQDAMRGHDYDLLLVDCLNDPTMPTARRLLAGAIIGEGLDAAYFSAAELFEAFVEVDADFRSGTRYGQGFLALEEILNARSPIQMRLWYLVHELPLARAMNDLGWLGSLLLQRGRTSALLRDLRLPFHPTPARDLVVGPTGAEWMAQVTEPC